MNKESSKKLIEKKYEQLLTLEGIFSDTMKKMEPLVKISEETKKDMEKILNEIGEISDKYNIESIELDNIFSKIYINYPEGGK